MSKAPKSSDKKTANPKTERQEKLAAALRANLHRRKAARIESRKAAKREQRAAAQDKSDG